MNLGTMSSLGDKGYPEFVKPEGQNYKIKVTDICVEKYFD